MYMNFSSVTATTNGLDPAKVFDVYALPARYYDPTIGRFTSFDSFDANPADPTHLNKYLYAGADPVDNLDPSGHDFSIGAIVTSALVGGILSSSLTGAYGYAKGYSARTILKASAVSFLEGAALGAIGGFLFQAAGVAGAAAGYAPGAAGAALGITLAGIVGPFAVVNFTNALQHGDSTDATFAGINLGLVAFSSVLAHTTGAGSLNGLTVASLSDASSGQAQLVKVTSWADAGTTPTLQAGGFVQLGGASRANFLMTGLPGPKIFFVSEFPYVVVEGSKADFGNSITAFISKDMLSWPQSTWQHWKGLLGQRQIKG